MILKNKNLFNKMKNKLKNNKIGIYIGLGFIGSIVVPISIYFTQTAYFYSMDKVDKKDFNNLDTIYSYNASIIDKYKRTIPSTYKTNIPIERYAWYENPWYKKNWENDSLMTSSRQMLVDEAKWMMDDTYLKNEVLNKTLKKHPAADYQYGYDQRIPNDALAVVKNFNVDLQRAGTLTTGLYIPPGEILKIDFKNLTNEQVKKMNVSLIIADNEYDNYPDGKITKKDTWFNRMPILRKIIQIDKSYFEFGTPFGGIVNLIFTGNPLDDFENIGVSISGAIETLHYIHGHTSEREWYRLVEEAKGPVAELATDYVSFITPKHLLSNFRKVNDKMPAPNPIDPKYYPYKVMDLFNKMAMDGHYTIDRAKNKVSKFRFLTTSYVRAGEAYAVNPLLIVQPLYWAHDILDYEKILNNGNWGIMHEMNHHNQGSQIGDTWGFKNPGESSNNVVTLSSYINWTNVLSDRAELENIPSNRPNIYHEHKMNGYISQKYNNKTFNTGKMDRDGFDTDYSVIMANFGTKGFQDTVRTFNNNIGLNAFGDPIEKKDFSQVGNTHQNAKFVDRISQVTGYNWSQYYLDTGLITQEDAIKINSHLNEIFIKNGSVNEKTFKPYAPLYSLYASDVKYDVNSSISDYRKVGAPFLIKKKYFKNGYDFKLEEFLETSKKVVNNTTIENEYYKILNVKLLKKPIYGNIVESKDLSTNKKIYNYKPNLKAINEIDEFEYSANVIRNASIANDLLKDQNEKITVNFKVKIRLEGNSKEIEVPNNLQYQQYKPDSLISEFSTLLNIEMVNNKLPNGKNEHEYYQEGKKIFNEKNLLERYPTTNFQVKPDEKDVVLNLSLNDYVDINSFTFYNAIDEGVVSGIRIEDITNSNNPKIVLETPFLNQTKAIYTFPKIKSKNIRLTFLKSINGSAITKSWIKLNRIDFGMYGKSDKVFPANTSLVQTFGDWRKGYGTSRYNKDSLLSINPFTSIYLGIKNTNWFSILGAKDKNYGKFDVYVDNMLYSSVNTNDYYRSDNIALSIISDINQNYGQNKEHIIRVVNKSTKPIEIQGFGIEGKGEIFNANINDPYYILVTIIPIICIVLITTSILVTFIFIRKKMNLKNKN